MGVRYLDHVRRSSLGDRARRASLRGDWGIPGASIACDECGFLSSAISQASAPAALSCARTRLDRGLRISPPVVRWFAFFLQGSRCSQTHCGCASSSESRKGSPVREPEKYGLLSVVVKVRFVESTEWASCEPEHHPRLPGGIGSWVCACNIGGSRTAYQRYCASDDSSRVFESVPSAMVRSPC